MSNKSEAINKLQTLLGLLICKTGKTISCKAEFIENYKTVIMERCISPEYICDNENDCHNGPKNISDEYGCPETMHDDYDPEKFFICEGGKDNRRLPKSHVCDFQVDCLFGEDEVNCSKYMLMIRKKVRVPMELL